MIYSLSGPFHGTFLITLLIMLTQVALHSADLCSLLTMCGCIIAVP